jgi:hypothetical protein
MMTLPSLASPVVVPVVPVVPVVAVVPVVLVVVPVVVVDVVPVVEVVVVPVVVVPVVPVVVVPVVDVVVVPPVVVVAVVDVVVVSAAARIGSSWTLLAARAPPAKSAASPSATRIRVIPRKIPPAGRSCGLSLDRWSDAVSQHPEALDFELHLVSGAEPAAVSELEDAARADRPRADHVARQRGACSGPPARGGAPRAS